MQAVGKDEPATEEISASMIGTSRGLNIDKRKNIRKKSTNRSERAPEAMRHADHKAAHGSSVLANGTFPLPPTPPIQASFLALCDHTSVHR